MESTLFVNGLSIKKASMTRRIRDTIGLSCYSGDREWKKYLSVKKISQGGLASLCHASESWNSVLVYLWYIFNFILQQSFQSSGAGSPSSEFSSNNLYTESSRRWNTAHEKLLTGKNVRRISSLTVTHSWRNSSFSVREAVRQYALASSTDLL